MLTKFSVKGFKCFEKKVTLDLTKIKNYTFNENLIKDGIISNGVFFGKNSSGKSNLGLAVLDIINQLTDKAKTTLDVQPYLNLNQSDKAASFYYQFKFDDDIVEYFADKTAPETLKYEKLLFNGKEILSYDYVTHTSVCNLAGAETLNTKMDTPSLSFVKYVSNNTVLKEGKNKILFEKFMYFVDHMLFYSLERNQYYGYKQGTDSISDSIIQKNKLGDFQGFLNKLEIPCQLKARQIDGRYEIINCFKNGESNFFKTASTGTKALALFYYWIINSDDASFIYMDEFDAYYHFELSEEIVQMILKERPNTQIFLTSHNTNLMSNDLLRPDCLFIMQRDEIKSMAFLTDKELRQAHNLQKMYKAGAFNA